MARFQSALMLCVAVATLASAQAPTPIPLPPSAPSSAPTPERPSRLDPVTTAITDARELLLANKPAAAVQVLEKALPQADGDRSFLEMLRSAYTAELQSLQLRNADEKQITTVRVKLQLIPSASLTATPAPAPSTFPTPTPPPAPAPSTSPTFSASDALKQASSLFKQGSTEPTKFADAAKCFAAAFRKVEMSPEQLEAWAYCRIRVANDQLLKSPGNATVAAEVLAEVEDALKLAPTNAKLQEVGANVLASAKQQQGATPAAFATPASAQLSTPTPTMQTKPGTPTKTAADSWDAVETANFRVLFMGRRDNAEIVAQTAEAQRKEIFARWSTAATAAWAVKCDVIIHPTAEAYGQATQQPTSSTGLATVQLNEAHVTSRRIDLRADDTTLSTDALPRELTYIVLADLFPYKAPPRWAEVGMAVLATSSIEQNRYARTLTRCAESNRLLPITTLTQSKSIPADRATEFSVESAALVSFFVKWKGEREFTTFLREAERYGFTGALTKHYGMKDMQQLETAWKRATLTTSRGQSE